MSKLSHENYERENFGWKKKKFGKFGVTVIINNLFK